MKNWRFWEQRTREATDVGNELGRYENNWIIYLNLDYVFESQMKISLDLFSGGFLALDNKCLFSLIIIVVGFTFIARFFHPQVKNNSKALCATSNGK